MCKHVLNAQVSIRAKCCKMWFDCPECHSEAAQHELARTTEMVFACKKCKKVFRKDLTEFSEQDEYCPHCDNKYIIQAVVPQEVRGIADSHAVAEAMDYRIKQG